MGTVELGPCLCLCLLRGCGGLGEVAKLTWCRWIVGREECKGDDITFDFDTAVGAVRSTNSGRFLLCRCFR